MKRKVVEQGAPKTYFEGAKRTIAEHSSDFNALAENKDRVILDVLKSTGFVNNGGLQIGIYREGGRYIVRDVVLFGEYLHEGSVKHAVLKIQGLGRETKEVEMARLFTAQNRSSLIRAPDIYLHRPWEAGCGYGFTISEDVGNKQIYIMPFANGKQMHEFARFYQEYREKAITRPWAEKPKVSNLAATRDNIARWMETGRGAENIAREDYVPYLSRFYRLAAKYINSVPQSFLHGQLTANHIFKMHAGYVLVDHKSWGWRPEWSDLAYNVWLSVLKIRNPSVTPEQAVRYVDSWIDAYKRIPVVKDDKDFDTSIRVLLLERVIGTLIADLRYGDYWSSEGRPYLRHILGLEHKLFDHLTERLKG